MPPFLHFLTPALINMTRQNIPELTSWEDTEQDLDEQELDIELPHLP